MARIEDPASDGSGNRHARLIKPADIRSKIGPVHVVLDVFLSGPDDLHWTVHMHGDLNRARDAVNFKPTTKAATDQVVVDHDLIQRQSGGFRGGRLRPSDDLVTHPDLATVLANMDRTIHGLHRRVRKKRNLVSRLDLGDGLRNCLGDITFVLRDRSGIERPLLEITRDILGAERRVRTVVPLNDQGREAFFRGPHVVGHDGDRIVQLHDLTYALDRFGGRVVDALKPATENR